MARNDVLYRGVRDSTDQLVTQAKALQTLIYQANPNSPAQFAVVTPHIQEIQRWLNALRSPMRCLSNKRIINWKRDNLPSLRDLLLGAVLGALTGYIWGLIK